MWSQTDTQTKIQWKTGLLISLGFLMNVWICWTPQIWTKKNKNILKYLKWWHLKKKVLINFNNPLIFYKLWMKDFLISTSIYLHFKKTCRIFVWYDDFLNFLSLSLSLSLLSLSLPLSFLIYVPRWSEPPHRQLIINEKTSASDAASLSSSASSAGTHAHIHTHQCFQRSPRLWHQSRSVGVESLKWDTTCRHFYFLLVPPHLRAF